MSKNPKVGGLFAGIGGIELGFREAKFDISWSNEIDKNASIAHRLNHDELKPKVLFLEADLLKL